MPGIFIPLVNAPIPSFIISLALDNPSFIAANKKGGVEK